MKKLILIILAIHCSLFTIHSFAQLPNFIKVDTGAITQISGGHISSTCFDMDNDGDLDLFVCNSGVYSNRIFSIFKNEGNGYFVEMPEFISNLDFKMVSSFGDIDNDGDIDLVLGMPNYLLKIYANDGYGNFQYHAAINLLYSTYYPIQTFSFVLRQGLFYPFYPLNPVSTSALPGWPIRVRGLPDH